MQTILVIDDDSATRVLTARFLTRGGFRAVTSGTVAGGLDLIKRENIALIVLDLHMPEFNGRWDALKMLKTDPVLRFIPVLVVSSTAIPDASKQVKHLGAAGFLGAPISEERVLRAVLAILTPNTAHAA